MGHKRGTLSACQLKPHPSALAGRQDRSTSSSNGRLLVDSERRLITSWTERIKIRELPTMYIDESNDGPGRIDWQDRPVGGNTNSGGFGQPAQRTPTLSASTTTQEAGDRSSHPVSTQEAGDQSSRPFSTQEAGDQSQPPDQARDPPTSQHAGRMGNGPEDRSRQQRPDARLGQSKNSESELQRPDHHGANHQPQQLNTRNSQPAQTSMLQHYTNQALPQI